MSLLHAFVSAIADDAAALAAGEVCPQSHWNADHSLSGVGAAGVLFNSSNSIAGDTGFTYAGSGQATLALGTITTNLKALNITATWNNAATTFDAPLFMNVTNTASASPSYLADLQVGSASVFRVRQNGWVDAAITNSGAQWINLASSGAGNFVQSYNSSAVNAYVQFSPGGAITFSGVAGQTIAFNAGGSILLSPAGSGFTFGSFGATSGFLEYGSDTLSIERAANPQVLQIYNTTDDNSNVSPTNFERGIFDWKTTANVLTIGTQAGGTGTLRNINIPNGGRIQLGAADAAAPTAQTLQVQSVVAGTANTSGMNWTSRASLPTGAGTAGNILINTGFTGSAGASTFTVTIASPGVFTDTGHNFFVGQPILLSTTGALPTGLSTLTTYYIISAGFGANAFEVSTSYGGAAVNTSGSQSGVHTATPGGTCTISNASPAVITATNHGLVPGQVVQFQTTGALPTGLSTSTNYFVLSAGLTVSAFEVSATLNGAAINTSSAGSGTQTYQVQGGTTQNPDYTLATWGPSQLIASQTTSALAINQVWNTQGVADAALKVNVTNINSAAGSLLADFQVGGTSQLTINKVGDVTATGTGWFPGTAASAIPASFTGIGISQGGANLLGFNSGGSRVGYLFWSGSLAMANSSGGNPIQFICNGGWQFTDNTRTFNLQVDVANVMTIANSTNASGLRVYNTIDVLDGTPTNYERGVFDWTTTANVLTIGTQAGGTGSARNIQFVTPIVTSTFQFSCGAAVPLGVDRSIGIRLPPNYWIGFSNTNDSPFATIDFTFNRIATKVIGFGDGGGNSNGWYQWGGQARVSANSTTTSTSMTNVPGLAFKPQASRNYSFEAHLIFTDAAAGGIQCTVNATSTSTAIVTTMNFDGWVTDTTAVRGYAQGTAFGNVVASSLTTGTLGHVTITGTIMTSATAPSTITIQWAQNTGNAVSTTILAGSYLLVQDMP